MSYESTKTSTNSAHGETMTSDISSQSTTNNNNFYPNNNNNNIRTQAMIMNPMMAGGPFYNGPPQGSPTQPVPAANRPAYQTYPPVPPPHHSQHHQIVSFGF
jgi:hypothetical protein